MLSGIALKCFRKEKDRVREVREGERENKHGKVLILVEVADGISCTLFFLCVWKFS